MRGFVVVLLLLSGCGGSEEKVTAPPPVQVDFEKELELLIKKLDYDSETNTVRLLN
jgi:hypothetical protein